MAVRIALLNQKGGRREIVDRGEPCLWALRTRRHGGPVGVNRPHPRRVAGKVGLSAQCLRCPQPGHRRLR